mmetsp:Transcript_7929/g.22832  ORF Transcript_7929/g.22832 Transcript_7929/m.22832 type:complete len:97 (-) Transcript_7929:1042-1332(-)
MHPRACMITTPNHFQTLGFKTLTEVAVHHLKILQKNRTLAVLMIPNALAQTLRPAMTLLGLFKRNDRPNVENTMTSMQSTRTQQQEQQLLPPPLLL